MLGQDGIEWAGWVVSGPCVAILLWLATRAWLSSRFGRSRRIPRCPGGRRWMLLLPYWQACGYDMRGVPASAGGRPRCPECGRFAPPRRLLKRPIKWRLVWLCVPLLLAGYASRVWPRVQAEGLTGWVPTWTLVAALPWADEHRRQYSETTGRVVVTQETLTGFLRESLDRRLGRGEVRGLSRRAFFALAMGGDPMHPPFKDGWGDRYGGWLATWLQSGPLSASERRRVVGLSKVDFRTRPVWPVGCDVYARIGARRVDTSGDAAVDLAIPEWGHRSRTEIIGMDRLLNGSRSVYDESGDPVWEEPSRLLGPAPAIGERIEFSASISGEPWNGLAWNDYRQSLVVDRAYSGTVPITTVADVTQILTLVPGDTMVARWQRADLPILRSRDHPARWGLKRWSLDLEPLDLELSVIDLDAATIGLAIEVLADHVVVATSQAWWSPPNDDLGGGFTAWSFQWQPSRRGSVIEPGFLDSGRELVALPDLDVEQYPGASWSVRLRGDPLIALRDFEATHAWVGEVTLPLRVEGIDWEWPEPRRRRYPLPRQP